jgi:hypothetical protein
MSGKYSRHTGLLITALLSLTVLSVFYGNLFGKLNRVCFASAGDGMQSYINMDYHIRHDSNYMRCNSMNYPYGEHVFFANNQPLISNTIKFVSQNIADISDYTLGILNFIMLFCLVITPVILYLIFKDLQVGTLVSIIASVGITFLSPQLDRFGGHFSLAYVCAIPIMILLLMRFFKKPSAWLTLCIFLTVLAGALTHFYLYGFFAVLILSFYAGYGLASEKAFQKKHVWLIHLFVQLVLPFLILQVFYLFDQVTDRTSYPWGFLYYRAYPQSIFLPFNKPYGRFLHELVDISFIDWEGYAYVGLLAVGGTIFLLVMSAKKVITGNARLIWQVTPKLQLNILFWASVVALLYSFGLPFVLGLQSFIDLIGPVRQMRGIARFSWVFYFVINIISVYWLWNYWKKSGKKILPVILLIAALLILSYDAFYNVRNRGKQLENHIPGLVDNQLVLPENQWIRHIHPGQYQAFIPLPYFHIGSENIWLDKGCEIIPKSFITIVRSGLPCLGVSLSRTSLNQTVDNIALMLEPAGRPEKMDRFPSRRPFLLLAAKCDRLTLHERQLISHATQIGSSGSFDIYQLPFSAFGDIADSISAHVELEYRGPGLFDYRDMKSEDSRITFRYLNFDSLTNTGAFAGQGCYSGKADDNNLIFSGYMPYPDTAKLYTISFWMNNIRKDLYPRTKISLTQTDPLGNIMSQETFQASQRLVSVRENWALVEWSFKLQHPANKISVLAQNTVLRNNPLDVDCLLIRPETTSIYWKDALGIWKNNRLCVPGNE